MRKDKSKELRPEYRREDLGEGVHVLVPQLHLGTQLWPKLRLGQLITCEPERK